MGRRLVAAIDFLCVTLLGNGALTERKKNAIGQKTKIKLGNARK